MPRQLRHRSRSEIISSILEVTNGNKVCKTENSIPIQDISFIQPTERVLGLSA